MGSSTAGGQTAPGPRGQLDLLVLAVIARRPAQRLPDHQAAAQAQQRCVQPAGGHGLPGVAPLEELGWIDGRWECPQRTPAPHYRRQRDRREVLEVQQQ
ncbi:MAG: hypothetical protein QM784_19715 [Polyangiaceae bacterium]